MTENRANFEFPYDVNELYSGDIFIQDAGPIQTKIMNMFRLTEEFKQAYGEYLLTRYPDGASVKQAVAALKKHKGISDVDIVAYKGVIIDFIYATLVLGFLEWEFFCYELEGKSVAQCLEFMSNRSIFHYYGALNQDKESLRILGRKQETYRCFKPFFKRDLISVSSEKDKEQFFRFCERHPRFILKPSGAAMGRGIRMVKTEEYADINAVFADVLADCAGKNNVVCEELIRQHTSFAQIHPESVNTVRVFTYFNGSETRIVCAWLKAGIGSAVVDNGGAGGMLAAIDDKTGVVYTDAADEAGNVYAAHPDTGFVFNGFQVPMWNELVSIVSQMAPKLPGVPMIGWDLALSEEKGWQVIEGNEMGQIFLIQIPARRGMRKELTERFEWDKHKKKALKNKTK